MNTSNMLLFIRTQNVSSLKSSFKGEFVSEFNRLFVLTDATLTRVLCLKSSIQIFRH